MVEKKLCKKRFRANKRAGHEEDVVLDGEGSHDWSEEEQQNPDNRPNLGVLLTFEESACERWRNAQYIRATHSRSWLIATEPESSKIAQITHITANMSAVLVLIESLTGHECFKAVIPNQETKEMPLLLTSTLSFDRVELGYIVLIQKVRFVVVCHRVQLFVR